MKAIEITGGFGLDKLRLVEKPKPTPASREVLVQIKAASLNYRDLLVVNGSRNVPLPLIPVSDAAGVVVATGDKVSRFKVGDRVAPTFIQGWISGPHPQIADLPTLGGPLDGVLAQYGVWDQSGLVKIPDSLNFEESACLPCAALSAWNALFVSGNLRPGETVLLQGTGGVSLFALQFAKAAGARVIITSSSDDKLKRARSLGADHCINYRSTPKWGEAAYELTGTGVDYVVEVGGADTLEQSLVAIRNAGQISLVGFVSGVGASINASMIGMKSARTIGIRVGNRDSLEAMIRAVAHLKIKPVIDRTFAFEEAAQALSYLAQGKHFGKVCLSY